MANKKHWHVFVRKKKLFAKNFQSLMTKVSYFVNKSMFF